ncbi:MAG: MFS transporter [Anaerolineales bacterium]|nr:MFS transporter [Anaerolineales bacterium]
MTTGAFSPNDKPLSFWQKFIYGTGDIGKASFNTLRQFFYVIFLTDVAGIDPFISSIAALISILWDAINDPLVGALSDRVTSRWGRRRPFLLIFAIPFGAAFVLLWWAPPWQTQLAMAIHVTLAYMISDTLQTLVTVPHISLTPDLARDYDERTDLTSMRILLNLIASLVTAVAAPEIMDMMVTNGSTIQQAYLVIGAMFGGISVVPYFLIFISVRERTTPEEVKSQYTKITLFALFKELWKNVPFRYVTGLYVLNWICFDLEGLMIPYFLLYWTAQGDLLAKASLFGITMSMESIVLGVLLIVATVTIPFWNWLSSKLSKRKAYMIGMSFWMVVQLFIFFVPAGSLPFILILATLAGISVSNAHILPESFIPDVIEWDELINRKRREGIYYGAVSFIRKGSSALATFLALQALGWFGYQNPDKGALFFTQPESALVAIRFMTGPFIAILLIGAVFFAWRYPLTRKRQHRVRRRLEQRNLKLSQKTD